MINRIRDNPGAHSAFFSITWDQRKRISVVESSMSIKRNWVESTTLFIFHFKLPMQFLSSADRASKALL